MPSRLILESIRSSKKVNSLTDFQFRIWIHLITYVDDYGRGSADPELLKSYLFPRRKGITETQIQDALGNLANTGMITLYEADGESYLYFPNWSVHQRIRNKVSKFPEPPAICGELRQVAASCGELPQSAANRGELLLESNPIQSNPNPESNPESNPARSARAHTRESNAEDSDFAKVMTFYMENVSMAHPSSVVTSAIRDFISELSADVVLHAMQVAAGADKHDWLYVRAILQRYKDSGLTTLKAVENDEGRVKRARAKSVHGDSGAAKNSFDGETGEFDFVQYDV